MCIKLFEIEKSTSYNGIKIHELLKNIFNNNNNYIINYDKYNYNPFETNIIKRKLFK